MKATYISGLIFFTTGSILCTFAANSKMFIVGRALAGLGASAEGAGLYKILRYSFPLSKQAMALGCITACQFIGLVSAPMLGGVLIDAWNWRLCFGIDIPLGLLCIGFTLYGFSGPAASAEEDLSLKDKVLRTHPIDTLLCVPALSCLFMAMQWGGATYGWRDARIIVLFLLFGVLMSAFAYSQFRQGDEATVPPRIVKNRSILAAMWYSACLNGILATTEYYMAIYYQSVRGYTATKSGLLGVPMLLGFMASALISAACVTRFGYYYRRF